MERRPSATIRSPPLASPAKAVCSAGATGTRPDSDYRWQADSFAWGRHTRPLSDDHVSHLRPVPVRSVEALAIFGPESADAADKAGNMSALSCRSMALALLVWSVGQVAFHRQAEGSLVVRDGAVVGSALLAQDTAGNPRYFQPRPSAASYATVPSGAGNQSWTSAALAKSIAARRAAYPADSAVPADSLTASGSGLDPDLSPTAIRLQLVRVVSARRLDSGQRAALDELVARMIVGGQLTPARINVLALNLALDARFPGL